MAGQGMMLYKNDTLFHLTDKDTSNTPVIVVTSDREIRVGHNNYIDRAYRNELVYHDPPWEYVYFATIPEELLKDMVLEQDSIKGLARHFENVPADILTYLSKADIQEIKKVLAHYQEVSKPKKYILIHGGCNEFEDELKISHLKDFNEAEHIIEREFNDTNYFGFSNVNFSNRGYWFSIVVTDDEKLSSKYRDALTYDEFKVICNQKFNEEAFINFDNVWHLEKKYANKIWTSDSYNEDGQTYHSGRYSKWVTH